MRHITFGSNNMFTSGVKCKESANKYGMISDFYGWEDIADDFCILNQEILNNKRGAGYWLWKPYLVYRELIDIPQGEYLIYTDAGVEFVNDPKHLIDAMGEENVFLFGNHYNHLHWCKGSVLDSIGRKETKQIQASAMIFRNSQEARDLVKRWLLWCQMPGMIDDCPSENNHPEFREHRHDQAILTCLTPDYKYHWWPAMYNDGAFVYEKGEYTDNYPVIFHHHRKRNNEW
jgi:hypothetical protein